MRISEVRTQISKYSEEELRILVAELYKAMPKKVKEEKDIDSLIRDVKGQKERANKKKEEPVDLEALKWDVEELVRDAYKGYYFGPNNVVQKKERSKWRFKVKGFLKDLQSVPIGDEEGELATELLEKLYGLLYDATSVTLFRSSTPFEALGVRKSELLDVIVSRKLGTGIDKKRIRQVLTLALVHVDDWSNNPLAIFAALERNLKTPDAKEMAIKEAVTLRTEVIEQVSPAIIKQRRGSYTKVDRKKKFNQVTQLIFWLHLSLGEYALGLKDYYEHLKEMTPDNQVLYFLEMTYEKGLKDLWVQEFERARNRGIKCRKGLYEVYDHLVSTGDFPEHWIGYQW